MSKINKLPVGILIRQIFQKNYPPREWLSFEEKKSGSYRISAGHSLVLVSRVVYEKSQTSDFKTTPRRT